MPDQMLFYLVFLSQVLLISFYFPRRILAGIRHVVETYPPAKYPRLYPKPIAFYERAQRTYERLNFFALLIGLVLVLVGLYSGSEEMLNWDDDSVLTIYLALQYSPMLVAAASGFIFFSSKRTADSRTTRRAELRRRSLFDFVSPTTVGLAAFVYLAFVIFIVYVRQFEFPWFGGYWNIVGITAINVIFLGTCLRGVYGKRADPYQAEPDRTRSIEITVKTLIFISIIGTLQVTLAIVLRILELSHLSPTITSLYFQLVALVALQAFRIDHVDFEVYREEPQVT